MDFAGWKKDADGNVELFPMVAFETFVLRGALCGLKIHFLESPADLQLGSSCSLPLILSPELARNLAIALTEAAADAELGAPEPGLAH